MAAARATNLLPGIRFEAQAPPLPEALPRMDIAVFVGFAASGPLDIPVALESAAQFEVIFGDDAPLAWDKQGGSILQAYLAPAVRAFFRNGGRRCWVVRVARRKAAGSSQYNRARPNYFPIPGMARAVFAADGKTIVSITQAFAQARSEGSWSDDLRVSATLETHPVKVAKPLQRSGDDLIVELEGVAPGEVITGDLLGLKFESGETLMLVIDKIEPVVTSPPSRRRAHFIGRQALRLSIVTDESLLASLTEDGIEAEATICTREIVGSPPRAADDGQPNSLIAGFERHCRARLHLPPNTKRRIPVVRLDLQSVSPADAPKSGSLVRIHADGKQLWMTVSEQGINRSGNVRLTGQAMWLVERADPLPASVPTGEHLSFEFWVQMPEKFNSSLQGMAFAEKHGQFWGKSLPTDEQLFRNAEADPRQTPAVILRPRVGNLFRFPLARFGSEGEVCFPLGMQVLPENYLGPVSLPGSELERDGLAEFDASLFLDQGLIDTQNEGLASQADFIRYLSPKPRALRGIHAALGIEDATIIAVPDAAHRGWSKRTPEPPPAPMQSEPPLRPEWWHFLPCQPVQQTESHALRDCDDQGKEEPTGIKPIHEPPWENFLDCSFEVIQPPTLSVDKQVTRTGVFTLSWQTSSSGAAFEYELEEAVSRDFTNAVRVYLGKAAQLPIIGRQPGNYYYRVRARSGRNYSDWSNGVVTQVGSADRWEISAEDKYDSQNLLAVQRALLRVCAVRGDMFAVLSLPQHFRAKETADHLSILRSKPGADPLNTGVAIDFLDDRTLSFGAAWHPWLSGFEENRFEKIRSVPPCGAISGLIARRASDRGAWVAPANEPLREVVALTPAILSQERPGLQEVSLNLIRQEPRGFLPLNSDTLSSDPELCQINVRRLLSLLRRLALKHGVTYVFEPHSQAFQRAVRRGFEALLNQMFERGAFAGTTPATSYQVVVDESLNTPRSVDQGRFIVELRVCPSLPLRFLTVRLVQSGDRGFAQEL